MWIVFPLMISGLLLLITNRGRILKWTGTGISLLLALTAGVLPINEEFKYLFWDVTISDQLLIFGRRFILSGADRPIVILLFSLAAFWFFILDPKIVPTQVVPLGLAGVVLILTAYAVDPLFYGALFFAFLSLIDVVLLSPPGKKPSPGVLRFLIFQILGILFILFAAWLASWIDLNTGDQLLLTRSLAILALGFSFLLAIFPFISWIPMIAEQNHPFLTGFVFNTYLLGVFLFGTRFLTEGGWIVLGINLQGSLQLAGVIMLGVGGVLGIFSKHLGRLLAAVMIADIGRSLLAVSLFLVGFPIYFALVIVQSLALGVWSLSLSTLGQVVDDLDFESVSGSARQWPMITSGTLTGYFTLAGLPLLAGFPIYWALGAGLSYYPIWISFALVTATLGLIVGGLRLVGVMSKHSGEELVVIPGDPLYRYIIFGLNLVLIALGLFPQTLLVLTQSITNILMTP